MIQAVKTPAEQLEAVGAMLSALEPFVGLSGTLPLRSVQSFLLVAYSEGLSVGEYARKAKMSTSTMSRNLLDIADKNRWGEDGFDLVIGRDNPNNRREKEYFLSPKGRALVRSITGRLK